MATRTNESSSKWGVELAGSVSEAEIVGYYSIDRDRNYLPDSSRLLYYNPPPEGTVHLDLNQGMESAVRKTAAHEESAIDHLLEWIKLNHTKIESPTQSDRWIKPDFVSSRSEFSRLLSAELTLYRGWIIYAAKWKGTIYLDTDKAKVYDDKYRDSETFVSRGFKFEQYIVSDAPDKQPDTSKPVIETEEFRCVYQRRIGDYTLLYTAKIHGVCSDKLLKDPLPVESLKFVEIRANNIIKLPRQEFIFHKTKLLDWWCQCFLGNTETVLCGFRDESGIIRNLKTYRISEIIDMAQGYWSPMSCIDYVNMLLRKISEAVTDDCETAIYKFEKKPYIKDIQATKLSPSPELAILPASFLDAAH